MRGVDKATGRDSAELAAAVAAAEAELGDDRPRPAAPLRHRAAGPGHGRGRDGEQAEQLADRLADVVRTACV